MWMPQSINRAKIMKNMAAARASRCSSGRWAEKAAYSSLRSSICLASSGWPAGTSDWPFSNVSTTGGTASAASFLGQVAWRPRPA